MRRQRGRAKEAKGNKVGGDVKNEQMKERAGHWQGLNKRDLMWLCFMRLQVLSFLVKVIFSLQFSAPPSPLGQPPPAHIIQLISSPSHTALITIFCCGPRGSVVLAFALPAIYMTQGNSNLNNQSCCVLIFSCFCSVVYGDGALKIAQSDIAGQP